VKRVFRWLLWIFLVFLVFAIFRSPEQAAGIVVGGFEGIEAGIGAIVAFFDAVLAQSADSAAPLAP